MQQSLYALGIRTCHGTWKTGSTVTSVHRCFLGSPYTPCSDFHPLDNGWFSVSHCTCWDGLDRKCQCDVPAEWFNTTFAGLAGSSCPAGYMPSWLLYANRPLRPHSRVCACVCAPPLGSTFPPFWSLPPQRSPCSQSSFLCMSHSYTVIAALNACLTVRRVSRWLTHSLQWTWNQTKTLITPYGVPLTRFWRSPIERLRFLPLKRQDRFLRSSEEKMKQRETLLTQMLLVMVVHVVPTLSPLSASLHTQEVFFATKQTRPAVEWIGKCFKTWI